MPFLLCFIVFGAVIGWMVLSRYVVQHSSLCHRMDYLASRTREKLDVLPAYAYDESVVLEDSDSFEYFDSCMWLCDKMREDGDLINRFLSQVDAASENRRLSDVWDRELEKASVLSVRDRDVSCKAIPMFLWHFIEDGHVKRIRPDFHVECLARVRWSYGFKHECFLYNAMALSHMAEWCRRRYGMTASPEVSF